MIFLISLQMVYSTDIQYVYRWKRIEEESLLHMKTHHVWHAMRPHDTTRDFFPSLYVAAVSQKKKTTEIEETS